MEITVVGRHTEVQERFRRHVEDKISKVTQLAPNAQRVDVSVTHEPNPRQASVKERVEITVRDRGPVIRAEASADDRYGALDLALDKLLQRLRRHRDRIKDRRSYGESIRGDIPLRSEEPQIEVTVDTVEDDGPVLAEDGALEYQLGDSPVIIREKVHGAKPITLDQAIEEMELVGHPFFMFLDAESGQPAVAYRRRGWTYGVIRLEQVAD